MGIYVRTCSIMRSLMNQDLVHDFDDDVLLKFAQFVKTKYDDLKNQVRPFSKIHIYLIVNFKDILSDVFIESKPHIHLRICLD